MTGAKRATSMYWKTQQTLVWQQTRCYARARQSLLFGLSWMLKISVWQKLSPSLPVVKFTVPLARNHRLKSWSLPLSKTLHTLHISYSLRQKKRRNKGTSHFLSGNRIGGLSRKLLIVALPNSSFQMEKEKSLTAVSARVKQKAVFQPFRSCLTDITGNKQSKQ